MHVGLAAAAVVAVAAAAAAVVAVVAAAAAAAVVGGVGRASQFSPSKGRPVAQGQSPPSARGPTPRGTENCVVLRRCKRIQ